MDLTIPDTCPSELAISRTTHLGIGAHQDDLEFMAVHGILQCYRNPDAWFGGIVCTDGAGSARTGPYSSFTDDEMRAVRIKEQRTAAEIGEYGFIAQLGHPSAVVKDPRLREELINELASLIDEARPNIVYTHNPVDKHPSHVGLTLAVLEALRRLPAEGRPTQLLGCEVWRDLDWIPDSRKVALDVGTHPELVTRLNAVFDSQISGGKRYDRAVVGRRQANATFHQSHSIDAARAVTFALDMTGLLGSPETTLRDFVDELTGSFRKEVESLLTDLGA